MPEWQVLSRMPPGAGDACSCRESQSPSLSLPSPDPTTGINRMSSELCSHLASSNPCAVAWSPSYRITATSLFAFLPPGFTEYQGYATHHARIPGSVHNTGHPSLELSAPGESPDNLPGMRVFMLWEGRALARRLTAGAEEMLALLEASLLIALPGPPATTLSHSRQTQLLLKEVLVRRSVGGESTAPGSPRLTGSLKSRCMAWALLLGWAPWGVDTEIGTLLIVTTT